MLVVSRLPRSAFTIPLAGLGDSYSLVAATFARAIRRRRDGMNFY